MPHRSGKRTALALAAAFVFFAAAEATWLRAMRPFYERRFSEFAGPLALRSAAAAAATYAVLLAGAALFVVLPALGPEPTWRSAARGAAFGLVVYGVYNLTNKSTLRGYSWSMVAVDAAWGSALFGCSALVLRAALGR